MTSPCSQLAAASASAELPRSIAMAALLLLLGTLSVIAGNSDEAHSPRYHLRRLLDILETWEEGGGTVDRKLSIFRSG